MAPGKRLLEIYQRMLARYGDLRWWPADTAFEVMVGAILTQATAWTNVEKAIANLKDAGALSAQAIRRLSEGELARLVYPSGYFNSKARKLKALAEYLGEGAGDDLNALAREEADALRKSLLAVYGIGEETADDILLYALGKPTFVIDAYTKRIFSRLGLAPARSSYSAYRSMFMDRLPHDTGLFQHYHALLVNHAKEVCKKLPDCQGCCLLELCPTGKAAIAGQ